VSWSVPVVFADAQAAGAEVLRAALAGRPESYVVGVLVGTRVPDGRSPEDPHLPYVMVRLDADLPHPSMADTRVTLRVTVWHVGPDDAHDLAQLARALLVCHRGPVLRTVSPLTGPVPATDPDSGADLSTFTVSASVRPTPITP
jgi:hypothetical protein